MNIKSYIENFAMWADKKNSLISIREYLSDMELNLESNIIHVAGTNGKGSVCAYLSNILKDFGFSVGTFTSPHLLRVNERISFNGAAVSDEELEHVGMYIRNSLEAYKKEDFHAPSYFEFLFYMAAKYFKDKKPDFIILETGLGGRFDITNVIEKPKLCIITSISLDHMEYLGDSIEKIAFEKSGILKEGASLILDDNCAGAKKVITDIAKLKGIPSFLLSKFKKENMKLYGSLFLNAEYKKDNALLALLAIRRLAKKVPALHKVYDEERAVKVVNSTLWQGRMQEIEKDFFIDGAHNEDGIKRLIQEINNKSLKSGKNIRILISALADKDVTAMFFHLKNLCGLPKKIYIARLKSYRHLDENSLNTKVKEIIQCETELFASVDEALGEIEADKKEDELIFAFGSLYLVAEILNIKGESDDKI